MLVGAFFSTVIEIAIVLTGTNFLVYFLKKISSVIIMPTLVFRYPFFSGKLILILFLKKNKTNVNACFGGHRRIFP